jgi:hypothetical protein
MKVVYCKISSWVGRVQSAEHYYVDLSCGRYSDSDRVDRVVRHNLTQSEADRLNRRDGISRKELDIQTAWEAGEEVGYFFSRERAVRGAIAAYKELSPDAILLVEGNISTYEPQLILDGPPEARKALNELYERAEANDWWEGDEEAMQAIMDDWREILVPEFEEK